MDELDPRRLEEALTALGETLAFRGASAEVVVLGGSGLLLLGVVQRTTHDVDVVALVRDGLLASADPLPRTLLEAAEDVGRALDLAPGWFNAAPSSLLDLGFPVGMLARCNVRRYGALVVHVASRVDQIHFKVYAAADHGPRSKHVADLRALAPTRAEFLDAARWSRTQDPSAGFLVLLRNAPRHFGVETFDGEI